MALPEARNTSLLTWIFLGCVYMFFVKYNICMSFLNVICRYVSFIQNIVYHIWNGPRHGLHPCSSGFYLVVYTCDVIYNICISSLKLNLSYKILRITYGTYGTWNGPRHGVHHCSLGGRISLGFGRSHHALLLFAGIHKFYN